ncbi:MAG TPA: TonB family protein [Pyrinomonadaceae bacterium]|nr:TonB family protein [Pyrinomonadaceae bacterium]
MNLLSQLLSKFQKRNVSVFLLLISFTMLTFALPVYAQAKLSLGDIFTGLRSKKATIEEKNKLLTEAVKSRGITFAVTPEIEKELEETGAAKDLIEAIKQKAVVVKSTVVPTPTATPAPTPIPTPAPTPAQPDFSTFQKKGDSNFVKGEYDQAVINYSKAIELNPKEPSIYLSRGLIYYNRKFYDLAVADYGKVIEIDPKETMAYYYRGDSYEKLGDLQKANDDYKKVLDLDSSNDLVKTSLQRVEAELNKNKPKASMMTVASKTDFAPKTESAKPAETKEEVKTPEYAELGSLVGFAVKLVSPVYPQNVRNLNIGGDVVVNVTIDEEGNPISVKATSGPTGLRIVSEEAVKKSKFRPAMVNNKPIKSKGYVTFKFKPF